MGRNLPNPSVFADSPAKTIITTSPTWDLSGVHSFVENLFSELSFRGWDCHIVLTQSSSETCESLPIMPEGVTLARLPSFKGGANLLKRQDALRKYLTRRAPCVYLPNFDFSAAGIIPILPPDVTVVSTLHSDEDCYYEFTHTHGPWIDGFAAVSRKIAAKAAATNPAIANRIATIPCGIPMRPGTRSVKNSTEGVLHVAYCGRLIQYQKRIMDLAKIINICAERSLPIRFTIAGDGADAPKFAEAIAPALDAGVARIAGKLPNHEVRALLETDVDVLVLTSEFEGLPVILLEAMDAGCVPVVTDIESGVREVIRHGFNGYLLPVGDTHAFTSVFAELAANPSRLSHIALEAQRTVRFPPYTIASTADAYTKLFTDCASRRDRQTWRRPRGHPIAPPEVYLGARVRIRIRSMLSHLFGSRKK